MKITSLLLVVTLVFLFALSGYAKDNIQIYANVVNYNSKTGSTVATGNVRVIKGSLTLTCLKAIANMNNKNVHLIGQVEAVDKNNHLYSDEAFYYSKNKVLKAVGSVKLVYKKSALYATILRYYMGKTAHYIATGKPAYVLHKSGKLAGPEIEFKGNVAYVRGGVSYIDGKKGLEITGDSATAFLNNGKVKSIEIYGKVHALRKSKAGEFEAWGDALEYDVSAGSVVLTGNPKTKQGERMLLADKIEYNTNTGELKASGNARIVIPAEK